MATGDDLHSAPAGSTASVQPANTYVSLIFLFVMWLLCQSVYVSAVDLLDVFYIISSMHIIYMIFDHIIIFIMTVIRIKLNLKMPNISGEYTPKHR